MEDTVAVIISNVEYVKQRHAWVAVRKPEHHVVRDADLVNVFVLEQILDDFSTNLDLRCCLFLCQS